MSADPLQTPPQNLDMLQSIEAIDRTVDAMHMSAIAMCRILKLEHADIPRLLVSAACRTLEKQIEYYYRLMELDKSGERPFALTERAKTRQQIVQSSEDMIASMTEALDTARKILASVGSDPSTTH